MGRPLPNPIHPAGTRILYLAERCFAIAWAVESLRTLSSSLPNGAAVFAPEVPALNANRIDAPADLSADNRDPPLPAAAASARVPWMELMPLEEIALPHRSVPFFVVVFRIFDQFSVEVWRLRTPAFQSGIVSMCL
jgi:hypothetical protein